MTSFREDEGVYPVMVALLACLCEELEASGLPPVCRCALMPGNAVTIDFGAGDDGCRGGCGQAWVRLSAAYPVTNFPEPAVGQVTRCGAGVAYELEVGVSRCTSSGRTVGGKFIPPTADEQLADVRLHTADMAAMRRAILCCLPDREGVPEELGLALGLYQPLPAQGGVGGGTWTVTVGAT